MRSYSKSCATVFFERPDDFSHRDNTARGSFFRKFARPQSIVVRKFKKPFDCRQQRNNNRKIQDDFVRLNNKRRPGNERSRQRGIENSDRGSHRAILPRGHYRRNLSRQARHRTMRA